MFMTDDIIHQKMSPPDAAFFGQASMDSYYFLGEVMN